MLSDAFHCESHTAQNRFSESLNLPRMQKSLDEKSGEGAPFTSASLRAARHADVSAEALAKAEAA
jgi:hypothetical protein